MRIVILDKVKSSLIHAKRAKMKYNTRETIEALGEIEYEIAAG